MAIIKEVRGHKPSIGENTFLADTAVIIGDTTIGRAALTRLRIYKGTEHLHAAQKPEVID